MPVDGLHGRCVLGLAGLLAVLGTRVDQLVAKAHADPALVINSR